jgi:Spy/CpxP family protein refolding chaperone
MNHKATLVIIAAVLIFSGSQANSAYSQSGAVAQNPKVEGTQDRNQLDLTADQRAQFKSIHQSTREQLRVLRNDQTLSPEQRQAKARSIREGAHQQVLGILTPQQQEIAKNNRREGHGLGFGRGFRRGEGRGDSARAALGLTDAQQSQLKSIHESTRNQVSTIHNDASLTPEQKAEKIRSLHQGTRQQVFGLLTPEQREKMKEGRRGGRHDGPGRFGGPRGRRDVAPDGPAPANKPSDKP